MVFPYWAYTIHIKYFCEKVKHEMNLPENDLEYQLSFDIQSNSLCKNLIYASEERFDL